MKKKIALFTVLALALVAIIAGVSIYKYQDALKVRSFSISDYQEHIDEYDGYMELYKEDYPELYITSIAPFSDADTLRTIADELWVEIYGEESMKKQKPYLVFYDDENDAWFIYGTFKKSIFVSRKGGVAHMIVKPDGKVLALWHDK